MATTLIIVRHGNTFEKGEPVRRVGAGTDIPLTAEGVRQAGRVGVYLHEHGLVPAAIFASPLERTMQSAWEIHQELGVPDIPVAPAEFLKELHFGEDDGLPETEMLARLGQRVLGQRVTDADVLTAAGKTCLERWNREYVVPPGWNVDVAERFRQWQLFAERILEAYADQTVLAVTSNGVARFAWGLLPAAKGELPGAGKKMATGAFSVFVHDDAGWRCQQWDVRPTES